MRIRRVIGAVIAAASIGIGGAAIIGGDQHGPPVIVLIPTTVAFGNQAVGSASLPNSVTVTDSGTGRLNYAASITGLNASQFLISQDNCGGTVAPKTSCTISVEFLPGTTGSLVAQLNLNDNAAGSPHTVSLTGVGITAGNALQANIWLSPTGSDAAAGCVRHSLILDPGASSDCATPQKACNIAQPGDTVGMEGGTYTVGFTLNPCNPASTIFFRNVPGQFVGFAGLSLFCNASNVTLNGDAKGVNGVPTGLSLGRTSFTSGSGTCTTNTGPVSNIVLNNVNSYCTSSAPWNVLTSGQSGEIGCNAAVQFAGSVNNITWNGNDQENWATCLTSCATSQGSLQYTHNTIEPGPTNITIVNWTDKHYWDLDTNGGGVGDHSEAWMIRGGSGILFQNNSLTDCSPPVATGYPIGNSCNSSFIFFGLSGGSNSADFVTFTQNLIAGGYQSGGLGQKPLSWSYDLPAGNEIHETWLYNTMLGGPTWCGPSSNSICGPGTGSTFTGSNVVFVGNVNYLGPTGTCFPSASAVYSHNLWYNDTGNAAHCNSTDTSLNVTPPGSVWVNPTASTFDFHLNPTYYGRGENVFCPATDILGNPRPTNTPCDPGAIQSVQTGASLASCTGGTCTTNSSYTTGSRPSSCSTTATPTSSGVPANGFVNLGNISDGQQIECRYYSVYVPTGLTGSAPVVVFAHGNEGCLDNMNDINNLGGQALANTNKFIFVQLLLGWSSSGTACNTFRSSASWFHPEADYPDPGSAVPQDYTYIQTVVSDLEARLTGSLTVDAKRLWFMGQSSGGGLSTGVMCNDATSSLFRGVAYDGVGYNVQSNGGSPASPVNGTERCGGGGEPLATNKNFFLSFVAVPPNGINGFCASGGNHCVPTFTEAKANWQSRYGCGTQTQVFSGSPSAVNERDTFKCGYGLTPEVETWSVPNSGDGYNTADDALNGSASTNGWAFQLIFNFLSSSSWTGP